MIGRRLAPRESRQGGSVNLEDVEPAIVVIVEKGDPATGRLQDPFLGLLATKHANRVQPGFGGDVGQRHLKRLLRGAWLADTIQRHSQQVPSLGRLVIELYGALQLSER